MGQASAALRTAPVVVALGLAALACRPSRVTVHGIGYDAAEEPTASGDDVDGAADRGGTDAEADGDEVPLPTLQCEAGPPGDLIVTAPHVRLIVDDGVIVQVENLQSGTVHAAELLNEVRIPRGLGRAAADGSTGRSYEQAVRDAAYLHGAWSAYPLPDPAEYHFFHHPHAASTFTWAATATTACAATWTNLTSDADAIEQFATETLTLELEVTPASILRFRAVGHAPGTGHGVFGGLAPIANLAREHRIYVPHFGGLVYDASGVATGTVEPRLRTLTGSPFWEAPVVAMELPTGSLGLWLADASFRSTVFFLAWTGASFAVGIEQLNLFGDASEWMPHDTFDGVWWYLDATAGNWMNALLPYKNWYQQQFAAELTRRREPAWADGVRVIADSYVRPCPEGSVADCPGGTAASCNCGYQCADGEVFFGAEAEQSCDRQAYRYLAETLGIAGSPATFGDRLMLMEANARCDWFDTNLPGMRVDCNVYPARNQMFSAWGLRTMAYVNTYFVNFGSPAFNMLGVLSGALDRKLNTFSDIANGLPHTFADACLPDAGAYPTCAARCTANADGCADAPGTDCAPPVQPACSTGAYWGELMAMDPLGTWWRELHIQQMLHDTTGFLARSRFDALYEDTAGLAGDYGNGCVDGRCGAQGTVTLFQEYQLAMAAAGRPTPLASEFGSDAIAFAVRWPLRLNYLWGGNGLSLTEPNHLSYQRWLVPRQRPVTAFLFDHQAWGMSVWQRSNFHHHAAGAQLDALGALPTISANRFDLRAERGDLGLAVYRAQLFAREGLRPAFSYEPLAPTVVSRYRDTGGRWYEYQLLSEASAVEDRLVRCATSPVPLAACSGDLLYARITGATSRSTTDGLTLLGWPARTESGVFGLNPAVYYNLQATDLRGAPPAPTEVQVTQLDSSVAGGLTVSRYWERPSHTLLVVDAIAPIAGGETVTVRLTTSGAPLRTIVNDQLAANAGTGETTYADVALPARFVFVKQPGTALTAVGQTLYQRSDLGHFIEKATGLDRGGPTPAYHPQGAFNGRTILSPVFGQEAMQTFDFLILPPTSQDATLEIMTCELAGSTGPDGSGALLLRNGAEVGYHFLVPQAGVTDPAQICTTDAPWTMTLPRQDFEVLISIATDGGPENNANGDNRVFSWPKVTQLQP
jgi:hypothetical protein